MSRIANDLIGFFLTNSNANSNLLTMSIVNVIAYNTILANQLLFYCYL